MCVYLHCTSIIYSSSYNLMSLNIPCHDHFQVWSFYTSYITYNCETFIFRSYSYWWAVAQSWKSFCKLDALSNFHVLHKREASRVLFGGMLLFCLQDSKGCMVENMVKKLGARVLERKEFRVDIISIRYFTYIHFHCSHYLKGKFFLSFFSFL